MTETADDTRPAALFRYAALRDGRGWRLALAAVGFGGHQLAEVMVPVVVGMVIDRAIEPGDGRALVATLLLLVAVFAVLVLSWRTGDRMITVVHAQGEHALRQRAVGGLLRGRRTTHAPGEVLAVTSSDARQIAGISWLVVEQTGAAVALLTAGVVLALLSWPLAVGVLLCTLAQVAIVQAMSGRLRARSYAAQRQAAHIDALGTDFALGLRALEALGATGEASRRYTTESGDAARAAYDADRANTTLSMVNAVTAGVAFAAITAIAGTLATSGAITVGAFISAVGLAQAVRRPLQVIGYLPGSLAAKHGSARRFGELLDQTTGPDDADEHGYGHNPDGGTVNTAHSQPVMGHAALEISHGGFTTRVPPGTIVGIRAQDAAATDLSNLLGARRAPVPGEVRLGGIDLACLPVRAVRGQIFAPPHNGTLFSGTIRDNLPHHKFPHHDLPRDGAAGAFDLDPDLDLDDAIVASGLDEVVRRLPAGLDERVGENGGWLSGGQRQRVLLARALRTAHPILVLHEPTTAIDPVTEARIARSVATYARAHGRTLILITGSPALLSVCDTVLSTEGHTV